jgi:hypothetical protein
LLELRLTETIITLGNFEVIPILASMYYADIVCYQLTLVGLSSFHNLRRFLVKGLGHYIAPTKNAPTTKTPAQPRDDTEEVFVDAIQRKIPSLQEIRVRWRLYIRDEEQQVMKLFR